MQPEVGLAGIELPLFVIQPTLYVQLAAQPNFLSSCSARAKQLSRGRWMRCTFGCSRMSVGG